MAKAGIQGLKQFERDLIEVTEVADDFIARAGKNVIDDVIREARAGEGPDGERFKPYSAAYKKRKDKATSPGDLFMTGIEKGGQHMLDKKNFAWKKRSPTSIELAWTPTGNQGDYGIVHQEGLGKMPKRTWMHLEGVQTQKKIQIWLEKILGTRGERFTRKYGRR